MADVERLASSGALRMPGFRLVRADAKLEAREYTVDIPWRPMPFSATADVGRVLVEMAEGATLVLQGLHHTWPALATFSRGLEARLGHPVQTNAYYTPRDSQGLPVHHDTHDVFVLQVAGEKRWLIYEPALELPLRNQRHTADLGEPGDVYLELTLRAGDTLYLPRGWLHQALTSDTDSLHLTVGINAYTWLDAVRAALDECAADVEFRRAVPDDGRQTADLIERVAALLDPDAVSARRRRRFVRSRRPILDGQLDELRGLQSLDLETPLERRPTVIAELDGTTLFFEGKHVEFPGHVLDDLEYVLAADGPFRASELPGALDEEGRLVLVRRLIREGFLRRSGAGA